jgi:hypothetical protein
MHTRYILRFALFALVVFPVFVSANTGLTIQPVKISQTLNPGQEASGFILLSNASEEDVLVELKVEDFIPTAGAEGVQFVGRAPGLTTVRDWVILGNGQTSFVFKKGEERRIPYVITAPLNAEPGSHFGVAFFKASKITTQEEQLRVGTQVGVLIFITVPGNFQQKGNILSFNGPSFTQGGAVPFVIRFENTGTVHFEPKGTISIKNIFGSIVGEVPIEGQVVLPTGIKELKFSWNPSSFVFGVYTASAAIKDGEGNELATEAITFYAAPVWYIVGFLILVVVIYMIVRFLKSRIRISLK